MDITSITGSGVSANNASSKTSSTDSSSGSGFSSVLSEALSTGGSAFVADTAPASSAPVSLLTTAEASHASRPFLNDFMNKTGLNFSDAGQLLYAVVGSNTDTRDWSAIMSSSDPVTTARQATAEMYGQVNPPVNPSGTYMKPADTVDKAGNFAVRLLIDPQLNPDGSKKILDSGVKLVDNAGLILRDAGSTPEQIAKNAWLFGFDTAPLSTLATAAGTISSSLEAAVQAVPSVKISNLGDILTAPVQTSSANNAASIVNTVSVAAQSAPAVTADNVTSQNPSSSVQSLVSASPVLQQSTSVVANQTSTAAPVSNLQPQTLSDSDISALIGSAIASSTSQSTLDKLLNS
jgi:hypothetical protein